MRSGLAILSFLILVMFLLLFMLALRVWAPDISNEETKELYYDYSGAFDWSLWRN